MHAAQLFVGLLVPVVVLALVARRSERVPPAVALVLGGIVVGVLPFAPDVELDPEVIFAVFLPPILYPSAYTYASEDVRGMLRPVAYLAVGLVLATMAAIALVAHLAAGLPWAAAFVLGAVLAPTDPVAATAVIRSSGAPTRLAAILEGESLVNDGTSLTALKVALAAVGGTFALAPAAGEFVVVAGGGALVGAALGFATAWLRRRLDDLELESAIAVLLAYGAFLLAERIGVSGVLATVLAGWTMGRAGVTSPDTRLGGTSFWSVTQFLAESILFLLVGLAFVQTLGDPSTDPVLTLAGITAAVCAAAIAIRLVWMFTMPHIAGLLSPRTRNFESHVDARGRLVLGWAGLRGAVSVAAALSIPAAVDGTDFPQRTTVLAVAVASIVVLLVLPALTLPLLLRLLGLQGAGEEDEAERRARAALAAAALGTIDEAADEVSDDVLVPARRRYEHRLEQHRDREGGPTDHTRARHELQRRAVAAQRAELQRLQDAGEVHGELVRALERDLDLEEATLR